jgi:hypothetical protein
MKTYAKLLLLFCLLGTAIGGCKKEKEPLPTNSLTASAGADQAVTINQLVQLDGSASQDRSKKKFTFLWTFKSQPAGSMTTLQQPTTATPAFTPDVTGTYVVTLKIANDSGVATDEVTITANPPNQPVGGVISQPITQDRVLEDIFSDPALADYTVTADINVSTTLTIRPGVVVVFEQDKGLRITTGALVAKGTTDRPVVFTGKNRTQGYWKGIVLESNSPANELEHAVVEYAGSSNLSGIPAEVKANIALLASSTSAASLKITKSVVSEGGGFGLFVHGLSELTGFANNVFRNNVGTALYIPARQVHRLDAASRFTGNNGYNGVQLSGTLKETSEVTWPTFADGSPYWVGVDLSIESGLRLSAGITLQMSPGVTIRVVEGGYLDARGTASHPITFTAQTPTPNSYWGGILFESGSTRNQLLHAEISYAGNKNLPELGDLKANVAVGPNGQLSVQQSLIKHGLGWGIAALIDQGAQVNVDVTTSNRFEDLLAGTVKLTSGETEPISLTGEWLDEASFRHQYPIDEQFYNRTKNQWFRGASSPWTMEPKVGFGLKIKEGGAYTWTIAEYAPFAGCGRPYSAEYITGQVSSDGNSLTFQESYWRSYFYNACDESQSTDTDVQPGGMILPYQIYQEHNQAGQVHWVLKLTNPDGSFFKYYRR